MPDCELAVSGMLLYAKTDEEIQLNGSYLMSGDRISVKTLDLNCEFERIADQLDEIVNNMRKAIDGLCAVVKETVKRDPKENALFLFCGKRCDRIKALLWEGDGFVLLYKRLEVKEGRYRWPRNSKEARNLTWQEFD